MDHRIKVEEDAIGKVAKAYWPVCACGWTGKEFVNSAVARWEGKRHATIAEAAERKELDVLLHNH